LKIKGQKGALSLPKAVSSLKRNPVTINRRKTENGVQIVRQLWCQIVAGRQAPDGDKLWLGSYVVAAFAKPDWQLVVDTLAAAVGENGRPAAETRPLLLVTTGFGTAACHDLFLSC
jgi:hypothetical protein